MKLFLLTTIVAPIVDFVAADGRYLGIAFAQLARIAHAVAGFGATLMPSIGG